MKKMKGSKEKIVLYPGMAGLTRDIIERMKADGSELLSVDIMLTQRCNFKCIYCYAESGPEKINQLTMEEAKRIVDDSADLGVKIINMQGGEPLIWRPADWDNKAPADAFFHLVEYARDLFSEKRLSLNIVSFTDVAIIDKQKAERLAQIGVGLCCKLDSLEEEIQDKLLGVKGGARKIMQGLQRLIGAGYGKEDMPLVSTNTVVTALNYGGVVDVFSWSRRHNFKPFVIPVHMHGAAKKHSAMILYDKSSRGILNAGRIKGLFGKLAKIDRDEFGIYWKAESPWVENKACSRHLGGIHVRADGMIMPCSEAPDFWALGDIRKDDFKKIVVSAKVKKFRDIYSHLHEYSKCSSQNCPLSKEGRCYGCRTRAYDDSGFDKKGNFDPSRLDPESFFAGDPACWRGADIIER